MLKRISVQITSTNTNDLCCQYLHQLFATVCQSATFAVGLHSKRPGGIFISVSILGCDRIKRLSDTKKMDSVPRSTSAVRRGQLSFHCLQFSACHSNNGTESISCTDFDDKKAEAVLSNFLP